MVKVKMMDENSFVLLTKDLNVLAELIRTRQEEKEAVLDEFEKEEGRYSKGNVSENAFLKLIKKTNTELDRMDKSIKDSIKKGSMKVKSVERLIEK